MYLHHKLLHIYDLVDIFISPSRFLMDKVEEMGFKGKIVHLPNFINVDGFDPCFGSKERTICYIGRLSEEKGILTLIEAVKGLDIKLNIIGEGPLKKAIGDKVKSEGIKNVELLGYLSGQNLKEEIQRCMFTVIPSEWYENSPLSVYGETGLTFESGNIQDLAEKIRKVIVRPDLIIEMGKKARQFVEIELNSEKHYSRLITIYQQLIDKRHIET
jgi:glycosyltransferase involved in cell wall biosynthesis